MKAAPRKFTATRLKRLFAPLEKIPQMAVAVSGGGDSIALLRLLHDAKRDVVALTVDHGLRAESAAEARQVAAWCRDLGIAHHTLKWNHDGVASGLQAKARAARYDLMTAWCLKHNVPALLTAHHADDQAETVAMRSRRTSSAKSLAAIWPETTWNGIRIFRPLLDVTRAELRAYLTAIEQDWIEDPSNHDSRFERVRIRQAGAALGLTQKAKAAQAQQRAATTAARKWIKTHLTIAPSGMMRFAPAAFKKCAASARDEALLHIIKAGGGAAPELARRESCVSWLLAPDLGRRTLGGCLFAKRAGEIIVAREPARIAAAAVNLMPDQDTLWDQRFLVRGPAGSSVTSKSRIKALKRKKEIPAFVDAGLPVIVGRDGQVLAEFSSSSHPQACIKFIAFL